MNAQQALEFRNLCIEVMARFDRTLASLQPNTDPEVFNEYRMAVGRVMGETASVLSVLFADYPQIEPTDHEWSALVNNRLGPWHDPSADSSPGVEAALSRE